MQRSNVSAIALLASDRASLPGVETSIRTPYVLTVDDEEAIVDVIQFLLESEGYNGFGISNSLKVPGFLNSLNDNLLPSVILLDLMMPGLSGYEVAEALSQNERYKHIPVIIMTAGSRVQSFGSIQGAVDFVTKPFHLESLLAKLKAYLDQPAT
jgi:CheY-like chemotaxis protein